MAVIRIRKTKNKCIKGLHKKTIVQQAIAEARKAEGKFPLEGVYFDRKNQLRTVNQVLTAVGDGDRNLGLLRMVMEYGLRTKENFRELKEQPFWRWPRELADCADYLQRKYYERKRYRAKWKERLGAMAKERTMKRVEMLKARRLAKAEAKKNGAVENGSGGGVAGNSGVPGSGSDDPGSGSDP